MVFLETDDEVKLEYVKLVADKAIELNMKYREDLANRIVSKVISSFKGRTPSKG